MTWFKCGGGGGGIPAILKSLMNSVFNKKFGTAEIYPPETWPDTVNLMGPLEEKTVSGSIVTFVDGADDVPLKKCEITVPANLTGVSSVDVVKTGKNLIKPDFYQAASNNLTLGQTDGTSFDTFLKAGTYTISYTTTGDSCYIYRREENDTSNTNMGKRLNATFTLESDGNFRFWLYGDGALLANISNVQIEVGSTATAYEPYVAPTTHTANLGRTIYGGEVDVVNGTGTDGYGYIVFDGSSDETWGGYSAYNGYYIDISDMKSGTRQDGVCNQLTCSKSTAQGQINAFWLGAGNKRFYVIGVYDSMGNTLEAFKTYLSNNPLILVYPLATPETFTFTPVPIISRLGDNTMWGDGDLSVVYRSSGTQTIITPTLISKTVTANGTYTASDEGADGYDEVTVNVQGVNVISVHDGKLDLTNGTISSSSEYCYTDAFDCPSGMVMFDFGETGSDIGFEFVNLDTSHASYWTSFTRYREIDCTSYYSASKKCRLGFRKAYINKILFMDFGNMKIYSFMTPSKLEEEA